MPNLVACITSSWKTTSSQLLFTLLKCCDLLWKKSLVRRNGSYSIFANWGSSVRMLYSLCYSDLSLSSSFLIDYAGKMFKSIDLPYVIQFAVMFHNDKPVDWLLDPIIETRYCPHDTVRFDFFLLVTYSKNYFFVQFFSYNNFLYTIIHITRPSIFHCINVNVKKEYYLTSYIFIRLKFNR